MPAIRRAFYFSPNEETIMEEHKNAMPTDEEIIEKWNAFLLSFAEDWMDDEDRAEFVRLMTEGSGGADEIMRAVRVGIFNGYSMDAQFEAVGRVAKLAKKEDQRNQALRSQIADTFFN